MKYEYEPVSGDQSLFDVVNAYDFHTMIVRYKGCIYSADINAATDEVIAERKVKEIKLPVVGDVVESLSGKKKKTVVYIGDIEIALVGEDGLIYSSNKSSFHKTHTIIDQSKQPNPVNMVEEKWFPEKGDRFRYMGNAEVFTAIRVEEIVVVAVADYSSESVRISKSLTFIKA